MGPLPSSCGFEYLLVTCDLFTKYVWIKPLCKATAKAVVTHLEQDVFLKVGVPGLILCDNGKQFKCHEMELSSIKAVTYSHLGHSGQGCPDLP